MMKTIRRHLIAGLLLWLPIGVSVLVLKVMVDLMDRTLLLIPPAYRPETLLGFNIPGLGILLTALVLILTGMLAANLFGKRLVALGESIVQRIPVIRSVYSGAKHFAETVFTDSSTSFKQVLLVQYPRLGVWSLAFQTSSQLAEVQARTSREVICAFVPTTPNPTSGFIIMVPKDEVIALDMEVEAAVKMIISLGVVVPKWRADQLPRRDGAPQSAPEQAKSTETR